MSYNIFHEDKEIKNLKKLSLADLRNKKYLSSNSLFQIFEAEVNEYKEIKNVYVIGYDFINIDYNTIDKRLDCILKDDSLNNFCLKKYGYCLNQERKILFIVYLREYNSFINPNFFIPFQNSNPKIFYFEMIKCMIDIIEELHSKDQALLLIHPNLIFYSHSTVELNIKKQNKHLMSTRSSSKVAIERYKTKSKYNVFRLNSTSKRTNLMIRRESAIPGAFKQQLNSLSTRNLISLGKLSNQHKYKSEDKKKLHSFYTQKINKNPFLFYDFSINNLFLYQISDDYKKKLNNSIKRKDSKENLDKEGVDTKKIKEQKENAKDENDQNFRKKFTVKKYNEIDLQKKKTLIRNQTLVKNQTMLQNNLNAQGIKSTINNIQPFQDDIEFSKKDLKFNANVFRERLNEMNILNYFGIFDENTINEIQNNNSLLKKIDIHNMLMVVTYYFSSNVTYERVINDFMKDYYISDSNLTNTLKNIKDHKIKNFLQKIISLNIIDDLYSITYLKNNFKTLYDTYFSEVNCVDCLLKPKKMKDNRENKFSRDMKNDFAETKSSDFKLEENRNYLADLGSRSINKKKVIFNKYDTEKSAKHKHKESASVGVNYLKLTKIEKYWEEKNKTPENFINRRGSVKSFGSSENLNYNPDARKRLSNLSLNKVNVYNNRVGTLQNDPLNTTKDNFSHFSEQDNISELEEASKNKIINSSCLKVLCTNCVKYHKCKLCDLFEKNNLKDLLEDRIENMKKLKSIINVSYKIKAINYIDQSKDCQYYLSQIDQMLDTCNAFYKSKQTYTKNKMNLINMKIDNLIDMKYKDLKNAMIELAEFKPTEEIKTNPTLIRNKTITSSIKETTNLSALNQNKFSSIKMKVESIIQSNDKIFEILIGRVNQLNNLLQNPEERLSKLNTLTKRFYNILYKANFYDIKKSSESFFNKFLCHFDNSDKNELLNDKKTSTNKTTTNKNLPYYFAGMPPSKKISDLNRQKTYNALDKKKTNNPQQLNNTYKNGNECSIAIRTTETHHLEFSYFNKINLFIANILYDLSLIQVYDLKLKESYFIKPILMDDQQSFKPGMNLSEFKFSLNTNSRYINMKTKVVITGGIEVINRVKRPSKRCFYVNFQEQIDTIGLQNELNLKEIEVLDLFVDKTLKQTQSYKNFTSKFTVSNLNTGNSDLANNADLINRDKQNELNTQKSKNTISIGKNDIDLRKVISMPSMINGRELHSIIKLNDHSIIVVGGKETSTCEKFNFLNNKWSFLPNISKNKYMASLCLINRVDLYLFFGAVDEIANHKAQTVICEEVERLKLYSYSGDSQGVNTNLDQSNFNTSQRYQAEWEIIKFKKTDIDIDLKRIFSGIINDKNKILILGGSLKKININQLYDEKHKETEDLGCLDDILIFNHESSEFSIKKNHKLSFKSVFLSSQFIEYSSDLNNEHKEDFSINEYVNFGISNIGTHLNKLIFE